MGSTTTGKAGLDRFLTLRGIYDRGQFGQVRDASTFGGKTACTHTVWQDIVQLWTGQIVTQDTLSVIAGYPPPEVNSNMRGFRIDDSERVIKHFGLPYKAVIGADIEVVLRASNLAPCLVVVRYKDYPFQRGVAGGRNGFALRHGANQQAGFDGAHATELGGYLSVGPDFKPTGYNAYMMEPNHGSPGRPEVDYDVITTAQLRVAYEAVTTLPGWAHTLAFIPTRALK